jgi:hypothetical protein
MSLSKSASRSHSDEQLSSDFVGTAALSKQNVYAPVTQPVNIGILPPYPAPSPGGEGMRAAFCGISDLAVIIYKLKNLSPMTLVRVKVDIERVCAVYGCLVAGVKVARVGMTANDIQYTFKSMLYKA